MKLADTFHSPRRTSATTSVWSAITRGRFGRARVAAMYPAEAERLVTPAEFKRLHP